VIEQMNHFAGCGECLHYLLRDRSLIGASELHPLLQQFIYFVREAAEHRPLMRLEVDWPFRERIHRPLDPHGREAERVFKSLIREHGSELRDAFRAFVEIAPQELIRDYERRQSFLRERQLGEGRAVGRRARVEDGTIPLGQNEGPEDAARRLAGSVEQLLNGGFYDQAIAEHPTVHRLFQFISNKFENLGQSLEFLDWLRVKHPSLDVAGDIPGEKAVELVSRFCEERGYSNAVTFAGEVEQWLRGEGDATLLRRLWNFVLRANPTHRHYGYSTPPFARYKSVPMHGMFLFLSTGDFPSFIEKHWEDLNQLTGQHLDVYYSKADLKRRVSGYETLEQFKTLEVRATDLPALVLWQESLKDAQAVPLGRLGHSDVVEVVKRIVQGIREKQALKEISAATCAWVEDRLVQVQSLESGGYVKNKFIINGGENVQVFNEPQGKTVAVAASHGAIVSGNTFHMDDAVDLSLTDEDAEKLRLAVGRFQAAAEKGELSRSLASEASANVWRVLEARESGDGEQTKAAISKWHQWFGGLDGKALKVLASVADVASLGLPLAKMLGFPVP